MKTSRQRKHTKREMVEEKEVTSFYKKLKKPFIEKYAKKAKEGKPLFEP